jgi:hypothetical protein
MTMIEINAMHESNVSGCDIQDRAQDMDTCLLVEGVPLLFRIRMSEREKKAKLCLIDSSHST